MNTKKDTSGLSVQIAMNPSDDLEEYFASVIGKFAFASYHRDQARAAWDELHRNGYRCPSEEYTKFRLVYLANFIAYCQALHSTADIAAQMINVAVFGTSALALDKDQVTFQKVKCKLRESCCSASAVLQQIEAIEKLEQYWHFNAFVNVIKHHRLLDLPHLVVSSPETGYRRGIQIERFEYRKKSFPDLWAEEVFNFYDDFSREIYKLYEVLPRKSRQ